MYNSPADGGVILSCKRRITGIMSLTLIILLVTGMAQPIGIPSCSSVALCPVFSSAKGAVRHETELLDESPDGLPDIDGRSFLLFDALSDTFLVGKNCDEKTDPASMTMVMTVVLALENLKQDTMITVTADMLEYIPPEYVRLGLIIGEEISVRDCIYASLLMTANDACSALAFEISGSREDFAKLMNEKAEEFGCNDTNFTNPIGYPDTGHHTTAHDMALIMKKALENDTFSEVSETATYVVLPTNKYADTRTLNNGNRFVSTTTYSYDKFVAGKTGYSEISGQSIVAAARSDDRTLIGVIFGASDPELRYSNLIDLFEYGFLQYTTTFNDVSEYESDISEVIDRINVTVKEIGMITASSVTELQPFITVPSSRSLAGYSTGLDLSEVVVDPNSESQDLIIPVYRQYADGIRMVVGTVNVHVVKESAIIENDVDDRSRSERIRDIIRKAVIILLMLSALLIALAIFLRIQKRRKSLMNRKNTKVL